MSALVAVLIGQSGPDLPDGGSDLHRKAYWGDTQAVRVLLDSGADHAAPDWFGRTPLHFARTEEVARALLMSGANPSARDRYDSTPLHYARTAGVASALIEFGADHSALDYYDRTPLHFARTEGIARVLLKNGADPNAWDRGGFPPLHRADNGAVASALIEFGATVEMIVPSGTMLHGTYSGEAVKVLVKAGLDPNEFNNSFGTTPLSQCFTAEAARALIAVGADPLRRGRIDHLYWSAFRAALHGDFALWKRNQGKAGVTELPLHRAVRSGRLGVVRVLLETGVYDPDDGNHVYSSRDGLTVLYLAARSNRSEILRELLAADFDPDVRNLPDRAAMNSELFQMLPNSTLTAFRFNEVGRAPLHEAARIGGTNSVRVLLDAGATVDASDWNGATPLSYTKNERIKQLLLRAGADPSIADSVSVTSSSSAY